MNVKEGDKIKFYREKQRYTVTACDSRFIIATKPFNAKKTFLYTIVDLETQQRSSDNWYGKFDYDESPEAKKCLPLLHSGEVKLSYRRIIDLDIERIDRL